jgi:hypothetical protein
MNDRDRYGDEEEGKNHLASGQYSCTCGCWRYCGTL